MPDTYITKAIKKVISDTSEKINQPLADIKRLEYSLDKASKQGTLTKTDLGSLKGQVLKIRRASDAIDITPVKQVLDTTKTTVNTIKTGKKAALVAGSLVNPSFGASTEAIAAAEIMIESSDTALEFGYNAEVGLVQDSRELGNITADLARKIDEYEKRLEELGGMQFEEGIEEKWQEYVSRTQAHSFYMQGGKFGISRREWVHQDPERFKLVLEHGGMHGGGGGPGSWLKIETDDWALNQRVDAEIEINNIVRKWIRDKSRWDELNQKVIDRTKVRDAAGYGTTEWEELSALNGTDLDEMDVITGNVVDYKSDYDAWESVLLSLSNTSPGDRSIPGGGSIRSGRINQGEYNLKITDRQKDLLDKSVGATLDLAWNTVQVGGVMQAYMMEYEHTQGGELVQFDFRNQFSSVSRSEWEGYEIHMSIMQEQVTIPGAMEGDWDKRYESRTIFIIINRYGTQLLEEHGYNRETGQFEAIEGATISETWESDVTYSGG